jgi:hypothetical protein
MSVSTAFEEERKLAGREFAHFLFVSPPQQCEASAFEPLLVDAQARAVPEEHLGTCAATVREQEEITGERVGLQLGDDQGVEAVVLLAHVHRPRVGEDADPTREADHARRRRS